MKAPERHTESQEVQSSAEDSRNTMNGTESNGPVSESSEVHTSTPGDGGSDKGRGDNNGDGGADGTGGGRGEGNNSNRDNDGPTSSAVTADPKQSKDAARNEAISEVLEDLSSRAKMFPGRAGEILNTILQTVPAPVLVALISITSTFFGTRANERNEQRKREDDAKAERERSRADSVSTVRSNFQVLETCLLRSSLLLALRLVSLVEDADIPGSESEDHDTYSAYLLARYFGSVELLKQNAHMLDLGFPAADRILINILGRCQGVLAADDTAIATIQESERYFKPPPGSSPHPAGPLRVSPRAQTATGEVMLRSYWRRKDCVVGGAESDSPSLNSLLTYVEFCELLDSQPTMQRWVEPLRGSFRELSSRRAESRVEGPATLGARLYVFQSALIDLVGFMDPGPRPHHIPLDSRQRLEIGDARYQEEMPKPSALRSLYRALSALRDGVGSRALIEMAERGRGRPLEVFVKAAENAPDEMGDCPYSQRVLLTLEELGVHYRAIRIPHDDKPAWFHLIHAPVRTPVVLHEGHLISESAAIVDYLTDRYRKSRKLAPPSYALRYGEERLTRFHKTFLSMLQGSKNARSQLDAELRELDTVLQNVRARNEMPDAVFFGGNRFSKEDVALAPFLYQVVVAGGKLVKWSIPKECTAVKDYLEHARQIESFQKTAASVSAIVAGYGRVLKQGKDRSLKLAVVLE